MFDFDEFELAYVECLIWSEEPCDLSETVDGAPWDIDMLAPETVQTIKRDCATFRRSLGVMLAIAVGPTRGGHSGAMQAGHDLWLTRAGHGCGFWDGDWDGDWGKRLGDLLTIRAKRLGELDLCQGGDGMLYFS